VKPRVYRIFSLPPFPLLRICSITLRAHTGIDYIAAIIEKLIVRLIEEEGILEEIFAHCEVQRRDALSDYYYNLDMKKADEFWGRHEYELAQEMYVRHFSRLTRLQKERLKYIAKHKY
jgi:hypothetical protein